MQPIDYVAIWLLLSAALYLFIRRLFFPKSCHACREIITCQNSGSVCGECGKYFCCDHIFTNWGGMQCDGCYRAGRQA